MLKKNNFFILFLFFFLLLNTNLFAIENVFITGNKNISSNTIYSLAPKNIQKFEKESINDYQKKLFESGFFSNVTIEIKNKKMFINVVENPLINFFIIEDVKNKETLDKLYEISKIKENTIFQSHLIKEDIKNFSNILNNLGYLKNEIKYQIIKIDNNKVNIFYKILLNDKFKINRIFFIGNKYFKSSTLHDVVYSSEHGWWKFLSNTTIPTESLINYDLTRLKKFYLNNGFYDIQISSNSIKVIGKNRADIIYSINAGTRYKVVNINLIDNTKSLNKENFVYLNNQLKKFLNNYYNSSEIEKFIDFSDKYLVQSKFNLDIYKKIEKISSNELKLSYFIENLKEQKLIEKITIVGNNVTDDFVVRNNIYLSEGDYLNSNRLNSSIEYLKGKGLFKNVNSEIIEGKNNQVELKIKVEEQPTGEISAGAGAGTNGATLSGTINENNFLGKGLNLKSNINIGTQRINGSIAYTNPDFNDSGNSFTMRIFAENNEFDNAGYNNKIIGNSVSFNYEVYDKFYLNPGLSLDFDSVEANSDASYLIKKREGDFYSTKFFYNIFKNTKNREILPSEGYVIGAGQVFSVISDIPYVNNNIFGSFFYEYKDNFIGSIKYKFETINGFDEDIKFSDRLFVSSNNLRGFSNRGIGPKINNDFIGGNYSYYTTLSTTVPNGIPEKWNATTNIFFDTANVWGVDDGSTDGANKIRSSIGVGLSWVSPLGPISFTYAEPLTKKSTDDIEQFNFKIGSAF